MMRVLVTGATGLVGSALCETLAHAGYRVRAAVRSDRPLPQWIDESVVVGDISSATDWNVALKDVDAVIHAAARVHVLRDSPASAQLYDETNARGTFRLAQSAAQSGVQRFVYLSSIKVNGEATGDRPFSPLDEPRPCDDYGVSKWQAEMNLQYVAARSTLQVVRIRPPLVYGPGVRANVLRLMRLVDSGWPIPLKSVRNRRSLVSVWNLCDLIVHALRSCDPAGRLCMVSDGEDLSTADLIARVASAMGRPARLVPFPAVLMRAAGGLIGKSEEVTRLLGSLQVDISMTRAWGWTPIVSVDEGLQRTVRWYLDNQR